MSVRAVLLLLAVLLTPSALGDVSDPTRPPAVFVNTRTADPTVFWVPGPDAPDAYKVYGVTASGALHFIKTLPGSQTQAGVPGGFKTYAVTALKGGIESEPPVGAIEVVCITIVPTIPPSYGIDTSCRPRIALRVLPQDTLLRAFTARTVRAFPAASDNQGARRAKHQGERDFPRKTARAGVV